MAGRRSTLKDGRKSTRLSRAKGKPGPSCTLLSLPDEILAQVALNLSWADRVSLSHTCKRTRSVVCSKYVPSNVDLTKNTAFCFLFFNGNASGWYPAIYGLTIHLDWLSALAEDEPGDGVFDIFTELPNLKGVHVIFDDPALVLGTGTPGIQQKCENPLFTLLERIGGRLDSLGVEITAEGKAKLSFRDSLQRQMGTKIMDLVPGLCPNLRKLACCFFNVGCGRDDELDRAPQPVWNFQNFANLTEVRLGGLDITYNTPFPTYSPTVKKVDILRIDGLGRWVAGAHGQATLRNIPAGIENLKIHGGNLRKLRLKELTDVAASLTFLDLGGETCRSIYNDDLPPLPNLVRLRGNWIPGDWFSKHSHDRLVSVELFLRSSDTRTGVSFKRASCNYDFSSCLALETLSLFNFWLDKLPEIGECPRLKSLIIDAESPLCPLPKNPRPKEKSLLANIDQISTLSRLRKLVLRSHSKLRDLGAIARCTSLEVLILCGLGTWKLVLPAGKSLRTLQVEGCAMLRRVDAIQKCSNLKTLTLHLMGTHVVDLSCLAKCTRLVDVNLSNTDADTITTLAKCAKRPKAAAQLTHLRLHSTGDAEPISTLSGLESMGTLVCLCLDALPSLADISAVGALKNLTCIEMHGVGLASISCLPSCPNLHSIDIDSCPRLHVVGALARCPAFESGRVRFANGTPLATRQYEDMVRRRTEERVRKVESGL